MSIASTFQISPFNGEVYYWLRGRKVQFGNERAVLWHHGAGGETTLFDPLWQQVGLVNVVRAVADAGFTVLSCDFGGAQTWGNTLNQDRIQDAIDFLPSIGCRNDKIAFWGVSMGFACMARFVANNSSISSSLTGTIPAVDTQWIWDNNVGLRTNMDAAFSPSTWAANKELTDPSSSTISTALKNSGIPIRLDYNTDDTVVGATTAPAFATLIGPAATASAMGTGGHVFDSMSNINQSNFVRHIESGNWT